MRTHYTIVLTIILASGCQEQAGGTATKPQRSTVVDVSDPDILPLSKRSVVLDGTIAILESDYLAKLASGEFGAGEENTREPQFLLAAEANASNALGIVGKREGQLSLDGLRIIVLHNPRKVEDDTQQATSFSVLSGQLFGKVEWGLLSPQLHFSSEEEDPCARPFRGCSVLTAVDLRPHAFANWESGGLGLPPETRLDAESAALPQNQTGRTIELWNIPNPDVAKFLWPPADGEQWFVGNRYGCAAPITEKLAAECDRRSAGDALPDPTSVETGLGDRVVLVSEADFQAALLSGELSELTPEKEPTLVAATIATSLNDASARGVRAQLVEMDSVEAEVLLVAKSPRAEPELMTADRLFVVPGPVKLRLPSGLAGIKPAILGLDPSYFSMGFCGPVLFPALELETESPGMPPSLSREQAGYGSDRQVRGLARSTIRVPVMHQGRQTIQMLACSHFQPPRPPPPPVTPGFQQEFCNGLDDNGNGQVDEGGCFLNACTSCVPVTTCGPRRCVSAPDGCGGLIACPCP